MNGDVNGDSELSGADEVNLVLDDGPDVYVLTIAGLLGVGGFVGPGGVLDLAAARSVLDARTSGMPRLRRRVEGTALVDSAPDMEHHVRVVSAVEGMQGFEALCARLATTRLPRDRPLWELLLVPGATAEGVGWVFRIHHAIADGTTAARLLDDLFDPAPPDEPEPPTPTTAPAEETVPRRRGGLIRDLLHPMRPTSLLGRHGPARGVRFSSVALDDLSAGARAVDATVNDAVLAAAGAGATAAFRAAGEPVPEWITVSVPVLLPSGRGTPNQVSAVVVRVPLGDADPRERAREVAPVARAAVADARSRRLPWFARTRRGGIVMRWFIARQRMVGLLSTNVRGPAAVRRLGGAPIERAWALPVIAGTVRLGVAAVSYAGTLSVAALWDTSIDAAGEAFAEGLSDALGRIADPATR